MLAVASGFLQTTLTDIDLLYRKKHDQRKFELIYLFDLID